MKKVFTHLLPFFAAVLFFASCSTSSFITKRRYTKGYYVAHATKPRSVDALDPVKKGSPQVAPVVTVLPETIKHIQVLESSPNQIQHNELITASQVVSAGSVSKTTHRNNVTANLSVKKQIKSVSAAIKTSRSLYRGEDDALSLFWIVILIILILWLLGLIANIGGLVNLLLLVALILLILWLLRIL